MAGFETWASFAGHPSRSATAGHALTFNPDHPTGAGQDEKDAAEFSLGLNYLESLIWQKLGMPLIGNWCANKVFEAQGAEHNFGPSFSCFIPNLFYQPGIAENLLLYAMCRARCVRQTWPSNETKSTVAEILSKRLNVGTLK